MKQPKLSIIIPTHNRRVLLTDCLAALARQTYPAASFEVIVVADDCQDGTSEMVKAFALQAPYPLRLFEHSARSASATRNLGAANAKGSVFLFVDDDIVAEPGLVQAHMQAHKENKENRVVLGYSRPVLPEKTSFWQYTARFWWEETFGEMARPGHRFSYHDFFSGNVSMPADLFRRVGGFDDSIKVRLEDYELGIRLLEAGARPFFSTKAIGNHHENSDLELWLERVRKEGIASVQINQRHPEVRSERLTREYRADCPGKLRRNLFRSAALYLPSWERPLLYLGIWLVKRCQGLKLRGPWLKLTGALSDYCFWRGVSATIGGRQEFDLWFKQASIPPSISGDAPAVEFPLSVAEQHWQSLLERAKGSGLRVMIAGIEVLAFPPQAGLEPLQKMHVEAALAELLEKKFVPAMVLHQIRSSLN